MHFATIDIVFAAVILIFVIRCFLRGFVEEFLSKAAVILGLIAAVALLKPGAALVRGFIDAKFIPEVIAFVALFLIVFIIMKILERMLSDIIDRVNLEGFDRILGLALGLVEGLLVVTVAIFILRVQPLFDATPLLEGSFFSGFISPLLGSISVPALPALPDSIPLPKV